MEHPSKRRAIGAPPGFMLDGPGLAAADAALAFAAGQQIPLTLQQQQQLLMLEQQHQQQQQQLHQHFMLQQRLLLQQQQLQQAQQALTLQSAPPGQQQQQQGLAAQLPSAPPLKRGDQSLPPLAANALGSAALLPLQASQPSLALSGALTAASLPMAPAATLQQALPPLGGLSWQLLSAARQQLDDGRLVAAELCKAGFGPAEAAEAAAEVLLANDVRRVQGLPPAAILPGLLGEPAMPGSTAATAAGAELQPPNNQGGNPMPMNPFAVAAAAAAAAAAASEQPQQHPILDLNSLPQLGAMQPLPSLPPLASAMNGLSGPVSLGTLSTDLHSLYNAWQDGNFYLDP